MRFIVFIIFLFSFSVTFSQTAPPADPLLNITPKVSTINFYAKDSVLITADTYYLENVQPTVLLCHQAGFSRGEYMDTAKKLNDLGFSCMAIDQRSGKEVNGIINQTVIDANSKIKNVGYSGAKQDLEAAIDHLYENNGNRPIILVGSSYSASLALWIGSENDKIKAVAAFSPGEYLTNLDLAATISPLSIPVFVTSSKRETAPVEKLLRNVDPQYLTHFKPKVKGIHGSRVLWDTTLGHENYWKAFKTFLQENR